MADRKDIKKHVLIPMLDIYEAPPHVRANEQRQGKLLERYITGLAPYDAGTVRRAAEAVFASHMRWEWPLPAQFVAECNKLTEGV